MERQIENPFLQLHEIVNRLAKVEEIASQTYTELKNSRQLEESGILISPKSACKLFIPAISTKTLDNWEKAGIIPPKQFIGALTFYKRDDILSAVKSHKKYDKHAVK